MCVCVCARAYVVLNVNAWFSSVYIYVCVRARQYIPVPHKAVAEATKIYKNRTL